MSDDDDVSGAIGLNELQAYRAIGTLAGSTYGTVARLVAIDHRLGGYLEDGIEACLDDSDVSAEVDHNPAMLRDDLPPVSSTALWYLYDVDDSLFGAINDQVVLSPTPNLISLSWFNSQMDEHLVIAMFNSLYLDVALADPPLMTVESFIQGEVSSSGMLPVFVGDDLLGSDPDLKAFDLVHVVTSLRSRSDVRRRLRVIPSLSRGSATIVRLLEAEMRSYA